MELLVRAACADDSTQDAAVSDRNPPRSALQHGNFLPCGAAAVGTHASRGHSSVGRRFSRLTKVEITRAGQAVTPECEKPREQAGQAANGVYERCSLSSQIQKLSPVFGPVTPDEQKNGHVSPLSINVASECATQANTDARAVNASIQPASQVQSCVSSTTPPLQEQATTVLDRPGVRRDSQHPSHSSFCASCGLEFSRAAGGTMIMRPQPNFCDHTFCRGCYEADAARTQLSQWPCPACKRLAAQAQQTMASAVPIGQVGPAVSMPRTIYPWPTVGPPLQYNMIAQGGPWGSKAAVMPLAAPNAARCSSVVPVQRPTVPMSARPVAQPTAPVLPVGNVPEASRRCTQPVAAGLDGAICKRSSKGGQRRSIWTCAHPGCQYVAHSSRHMLRHMTTHSGERPFACTWPGCNYRARQREHLKTHELKHSNVKSFKCHVCDFATKRKEHLKRHLRRHASDGGSRGDGNVGN